MRIPKEGTPHRRMRSQYRGQDFDTSLGITTSSKSGVTWIVAARKGRRIGWNQVWVQPCFVTGSAPARTHGGGQRRGAHALPLQRALVDAGRHHQRRHAREARRVAGPHHLPCNDRPVCGSTCRAPRFCLVTVSPHAAREGAVLRLAAPAGSQTLITRLMHLLSHHEIVHWRM